MRDRKRARNPQSSYPIQAFVGCLSPLRASLPIALTGVRLQRPPHPVRRRWQERPSTSASPRSRGDRASASRRPVPHRVRGQGGSARSSYTCARRAASPSRAMRRVDRSTVSRWLDEARWLARISHQAACRRQKAHGFQEVDRDADDRADCGLRWPRPRGSFGPVRAHAPSTVVPAMLSVASTRTEPKSSAIITAPGEKCGLGLGVRAAAATSRATGSAPGPPICSSRPPASSSACRARTCPRSAPRGTTRSV